VLCHVKVKKLLKRTKSAVSAANLQSERENVFLRAAARVGFSEGDLIMRQQGEFCPTKFRSFLKSRGLTIEVLADAIGTNASTISKWGVEKNKGGRRQPRSAHFKRVLEVLNCSPSQFLVTGSSFDLLGRLFEEDFRLWGTQWKEMPEITSEKINEMLGKVRPELEQAIFSAKQTSLPDSNFAFSLLVRGIVNLGVCVFRVVIPLELQDAWTKACTVKAERLSKLSYFERYQIHFCRHHVCYDRDRFEASLTHILHCRELSNRLDEWFRFESEGHAGRVLVHSDVDAGVTRIQNAKKFVEACENNIWFGIWQGNLGMAYEKQGIALDKNSPNKESKKLFSDALELREQQMRTASPGAKTWRDVDWVRIGNCENLAGIAQALECNGQRDESIDCFRHLWVSACQINFQNMGEFATRKLNDFNTGPVCRLGRLGMGETRSAD